MTPEDRKLFFEGAIKHGNLGRAFYEVACEFAGPNHEAFTIKVFYEAIRAAQAEQRQRIIAIIKGGDRPWQELVDAILAQEE